MSRTYIDYKVEIESIQCERRTKYRNQPHIEVLNGFSNIGKLYNDCGLYNEAFSNYKAALDVALKLYGTNCNDEIPLAQAYVNLARQEIQQAQYNIAGEHLNKALVIYKEVDICHIGIAEVYNCGGKLLKEQGRHDLAAQSHHHALAHLLTIFEDNNNREIAFTDGYRGQVDHADGNYSGATQCYNNADDILYNIYYSHDGDDSAPSEDVLNRWCSMLLCWAETDLAKGDFPTALSRCEQAASILEHFDNNNMDVLQHAEIFEAWGNVYLEKGDYSNAFEQYDAALEILETFSAGKDIKTAYMARNYVHTALVQQKTYALTYADQSLNAALAIYKKLYVDDCHPDIGKVHNLLASVARSRGEFTMPLVQHCKALAMYTSCHGKGKDHVSVAYTYSLMGAAYCELQDYDRSHEYNFQSLNMNKRIYKKNRNTLALATNYCNIGTTFLGQEQYVQADQYLNKAFHIARNLYGTCRMHSILVDILNRLAIVYRQTGNLEKAIEFHKKAEVKSVILSPRYSNIEMATSAGYLGDLLYLHGDFRKALDYYTTAVDHCSECERAHDYNSLEHSKYLTAVGRTLYRLYEPDLALQKYSASQLILDKILGDETCHPGQAIIQKYVGDIRSDQGAYSSALECYKIALGMKLITYKEYMNRDDIGELNHCIGNTYSSLELHCESLLYHQRSLAIRQLIFEGVNNSSLAESFDSVGKALLNQIKLEGSLKFFEKSLEMKKQIYSKDLSNQEICDSYILIGNWHNAQGQFRKGNQFHERALDLAKSRSGPQFSRLDVAHCYDQVGKTMTKMGEQFQANTALNHSLSIRHLAFQEPMDVADTKEKKVRVYLEFGPALATTYMYMGDSYYAHGTSIHYFGKDGARKGKFAKAREYYEKALELFQYIYGIHVNIAAVETQMGLICQQPTVEKYDEALKHHKVAVMIRETIYKGLNGNHPDIIRSYINLGTTYTCLKQDEEALGHLNAASSKMSNDSQFLMADLHEAIGSVHFLKSNFKEALKFYHICENMRTKKHGACVEFNSELANIYQHLKDTYSQLGQDKLVAHYESLVRRTTIPHGEVEQPRDRCKVM